MAIEICDYCAGQRYTYAPKPSNFEKYFSPPDPAEPPTLLPEKVTREQCPKCKGIGKQRRPGDQFTTLEQIAEMGDRELLEALALMSNFIRLNAEKGILRFVSMPEQLASYSDDGLLNLLKNISYIGKVMEVRHGWLVIY